MKLSAKEVKNIARLARLSLSDAEVNRQSEQLSQILSHMEKLNELPTDKIEATAHAMFVPTPVRPDTARQDTTREASLESAPEREGPFFKVPKVL